MEKKTIKNILFLFGALFFTFSSNAQSPQERFEEGNQMYQRQAYDSALLVYNYLIDAGFSNKALYFNAGNASYKLGDAGYAIYYYNKALQKAPGNKTIVHNLHLAQIKAYNKTKQIPTIFLVRWWHAILTFFSVNTWLILSILFFWVLLFCIGWSLFTVSPPRLILRLRPPLAILFCFFFIGSIFSLKAYHTHNSAIIVSTEMPLKTAPDAGSNDVEVLNEGIKVDIMDSVADWKKIKLTDGTVGWLNNKDLKVL